MVKINFLKTEAVFTASIYASLNFKTITFPVCLNYTVLTIFGSDTHTMFHTENTLVILAVNVFENILKIDLASRRFITPWIISEMERCDFTPGSFNIRNQVTFGDLLVIDIIHDLADRPVNSSAY